MTELPILLTEAEAAARLRVCTRTLRKERQAGRLTYVRIGTKVLYSPDDLNRFIKDARECLSPALPARRSGASHATSAVRDFEAALARRRSGRGPGSA